MKRTPKLSKTELVILKLLVGGRELYGLEMIKREPKLKRGTIYVLLGRLEEKGFVKSRQEIVSGVAGLPRRLYSITGAGAAVRSAYSAMDAALERLDQAGKPA